MPAGNLQYTLPFNDASGSATAGPSSYGMPYNSYDYGAEEEEPNVVGGFGFKGRVVHEAGSTVGREQSITSFDLSPYVFVDDLVLFGEGRLGLGNNGKTFGSLGGGARYFMPRLNSVVGVSGWYDMDQSRGPLFQQWGLSGEFLSEYLDVRGNWYNPVGETSKITSERFEAGSQHFIDRPLVDVNPGEAQGSYLAFQRRVFTATVMKGFDTLFSVPVPGKVAQALNLEAGAGFYNYSVADDTVDEVWGWRARADAEILEKTSHLFLEVMHDKTFKTNVVFGIDINYWGNLGHRPRLGHSQHHRLAEWVRRNRTMVAYEGSFLREPELAVNPRTSNPYVIYQVWENPANLGPEDGTSTNPFQTLNGALATPGADIVFVQSGSVITNSVSIDTPFTQVIGEQANPTIGISVQNLSGSVVLPSQFTGLFQQPVIDGVTDNYAVRLNAAGVRFAGIDITNFTGDGTPNSAAIQAQSQSFGGGSVPNTLDTVKINGVQNAHGIYLTDLSGTMTNNNVSLTSIQGDAFRVERGSANIAFTGDDNFIDNTSATLGAHGYAVHLIDTAGAVNMGSVAIADNGGSGVRVVGKVINPNTARISFGETTLTGSNPLAGEGVVHIEDFNGTINFTDTLTIDQAGGSDGDALVVRRLEKIVNSPISGSVGFAEVNILNRRGSGIVAEDLLTTVNAPAQVTFSGPVNLNGMDAGFVGTDPAIHFNTASGTLWFLNDVTVNGSAGNGVEISNILDDGSTVDGTFLSQGTMTLTDIAGTSFNVDTIEKDNFFVRTGGLVINNRGAAGSNGTAGAGIRIFDFAGTANFLGPTTVNNQNGSFATAINIQSNDPVTFDKTVGGISFSTINVLDQLGAGSYGVLVLNNAKEAGVTLGELNVTSRDAEGVLLRDNARVTVTGGTISSTDARAITVDTLNGAPPGSLALQQHSVNLSSVSASGADYGIRVNNSQGSFVVLGQDGNPGSGGTISNMTIAGASFQNTQLASLSNMSLNANTRGVVANNLLVSNNSIVGELFLNGVTINGSAGEAVMATDVRYFTLQNSNLQNNGATLGTEQVDFLANTGRIDLNGDSIVDNVRYVVRITGNNITDSATASAGSSNMIFLHTASGIANPAELELYFLNNGSPGDISSANSITMNRTNAAALNVTWQGSFAADINDNQFQLLNGTDQRAIDMNITGTGAVNVLNNSIVANGAFATGVRGLFTQTSTISVRGNQQTDDDGNLVPNSGFVFNGLGSTGVDLSLQGNGSRAEVSDNLIQFGDNARSGVGILFSQIRGVNGDTIVTMNGNTIELFDLNAGNIFTIERGIQFVNTQGVITLQGNVSNSVYPLNNPPWYIDFSGLSQAQTNGTTIIVNGSAVPF